MTGDRWFDRLELALARAFPSRGRRLRARVGDRRLARMERMRRERDRALDSRRGANRW